MSAAASSEIRVVAFLRAKPGEAEAIEAAARACIPPTRAEAGNRSYVLHRECDDPDTYVFIETWQSKAALDAHMQTAHFKQFAAAVESRLASPLEVVVVEEIA